MHNFFKHLKTVNTHRFWVWHYARLAGIGLRGFFHDISKYSYTEFSESMHYFTGTYSPIDKCKKEKGYSLAWLHHRSHNKHHREYWTDNYDLGTTCVKIPFVYCLEMICDFLAAGKTYSLNAGKDFSIQSELDWWNAQLEHGIKMHPESLHLIHIIFLSMRETGIENTLKNHKFLKYLKSQYIAGDMANELPEIIAIQPIKILQNAADQISKDNNIKITLTYV